MLLWTGADRSSRENRPGQIYRGGAGAGGEGGDGEEGGDVLHDLSISSLANGQINQTRCCVCVCVCFLS